VYLLISTEWIDKIIAAVGGGILMIVIGIMNEKTAFSYIDWDVLFLLIGMMIIIACTKSSGMYQYIAIKTAKVAKGKPINIMLLMFVVTAVISAFLPNVTTIMIILPVTILICSELGINAVPFIITQAIASNIGGTATLIGDPPNVMIGSATGLNFMEFVYNLTPIIMFMIVVNLFVVYLIFHKSMTVSNEKMAIIREFDDSKLITDRPLMIKSIIVITGMIACFLMQGIVKLDTATIALSFAIIMLILSKPPSVEKILAEEIEWGSIFFFIGLFMVVGGLVETGFITVMANKVVHLTNGDMRLTSDIIVWASGILSAVIDNIPFVATMIPLIKDIGIGLGANGNELIKPLWWALSLGACLGGNGTLVGASANIVSAGIANKNGYKVTFWGFTKYGAILTVINLFISMIYMRIRYF
jgi:Na+/H+ antiporter NhaD/arsenite permease-like protein